MDINMFVDEILYEEIELAQWRTAGQPAERGTSSPVKTDPRQGSNGEPANDNGRRAIMRSPLWTSVWQTWQLAFTILLFVLVLWLTAVPG